MPPLVSVVIPTYNRVQSLVQATQSIINGTYENIEVIVIDDASLDQTPELLTTILDKRIRSYRNKKNLGPALSYMEGIKRAKGKYIIFQDSDDISLPDRIEKCVEALELMEDDVLYHSIYSVVDGHFVYKPAQEWIDKKIFREQYIPGIICAKASLLKKFTIPKSFMGAWDWYLHIWLHEKRAKYMRISDGVYLYFRHAGGQAARNEMSGDRQKSIKAIQKYLFDKKLIPKNHKFEEAFS